MRAALAAWAAVLVLLQGGCFFIWPGSGTRTKHKSQSIAARNIAPVTIDTELHAKTELLELKVRIWCDEQFRSMTPRWRDQVRARMNRVNGYLGTTLGVRLAVDAIEPWQRKGSDSSDLGGILWELHEHDDGKGVEWVIGLVAPPASVTTQIHHLGMAEPISKYFVVRGADDARDIKALDEWFDALSARERTNLYSRFKSHRELVVFLHEWAHTLGALHVNEPTDFMFERHDPKQAGFAEQALRYLRLALEARVPGAGPDEREVLARFVEKMTWEGWGEEDRALLIRLLRRNATSARIDQAAIPEPILATMDDPTWARATELTAAGDYPAAWKTLAELVELYPEQAGVQLLGCELAAHVADRKAMSACDAAARLRPADATPLVAKATTLAALGRRAEALAAAAAARRLLAEGNPRPGAWSNLASLYQGMYAVSLAVELAEKLDAGSAERVKEWAASTRRWVAFPARITAEAEPDYADLVMRANTVLDESTLGEVQRLVARGARSWPDAPGLLALRCAVLCYRDEWKAAEKTCARSLAAYPDGLIANFWSAQAALARKDHRRAARHLEKIIALDPELAAAWEVLAEVYAGDAAKLADLEARYRKQFGGLLRH